MERIECKGCKTGVEFCHHRPCMGTVEELEKIMDAGHSKNLMLDYWSRKEGGNIEFLCGAIVDYETKKAPLWPVGTCTFLKDDLCSIHEIKPLEGATSCCKIDTDEDLRKDLAGQWDTATGRALVERWKQEVSYTNKTNDLTEFLEFLDKIIK